VVSLSVSLSVTFVHCVQLAEDIDTISARVEFNGRWVSLVWI